MVRGWETRTHRKNKDLQRWGASERTRLWRGWDRQQAPLGWYVAGAGRTRWRGTPL